MSETAILFVLVYVLGLAAALFVRPIFGLYTYVGVFYVHPPSRWWGDLLPDIRWSLLAAVVTLIASALHKEVLRNPYFVRSWYQHTALAALLVYTIWMWIQAIWVPSPLHLEGTILFTKYCLLIFLMYGLLQSETDFRDFCLVHVIGCTYFGWLVFQAPDGGRLEGVGGPGVDDANSLAMHLSTGLMFASFLLLSEKGWRRLLIFASIPFILNGIIQTETRGALVGLMLGGIATIYLKPHSIRKTYYALAALAAIGLLVIANEAFIARMETMRAAVDQEQEWDNSAASRLAIISAQIEMSKSFPLGVGHQGTAYLSGAYLDERWLSNKGGRASHNTVMSVLVDQGVPGLLIYTLLAIAILRMLVRIKRLDKHGLSKQFGLFRAMIGGAIVSSVGAGMFAQNLRAEVQIWCIVLLVLLHELSHIAIGQERGIAATKMTDFQQSPKVRELRTKLPSSEPPARYE